MIPTQSQNFLHSRKFQIELELSSGVDPQPQRTREDVIRDLNLSSRLAFFFSTEEDKMELKETGDPGTSREDVEILAVATVWDDYDKVLAEIDAKMKLLELFLSRCECPISVSVLCRAHYVQISIFVYDNSRPAIVVKCLCPSLPSSCQQPTTTGHWKSLGHEYEAVLRRRI